MTKLSILIPTITSRREMFFSLTDDLKEQANKFPGQVQIKFLVDEGENSIGQKRNALLCLAIGEYVCFVDDDDRVSSNYIDLLMEGVNKGVDCCSLRGEITTDGKNPKPFIHSLDYKEWFEKDGVYYRGINHLNCVKREIAVQIGFPEKNHGEDYDYSMKLMKSGLLKTEHKIEEILYYYKYISKK